MDTLSSQKAGRILLVEDEHGLRALLALILETEGYQVLEAADSVEADRLWTENPDIELLITDVRLPGASGVDFASLIRFRKPTIKVLFMSGAPSVVASAELGKISETPALQKPFLPRDLLAEVRRLMTANQPTH